MQNLESPDSQTDCDSSAGYEMTEVDVKPWDESPKVTALGHHLLHHQHQPILFCNAITDWPAALWTPDSLEKLLPDKALTFRMGKKYRKDVEWETQCCYEKATLGEFVKWTEGSSECATLSGYDPALYWAYFDYKHMLKEFPDRPDIQKAVDWTSLGFPGRSGDKSTFWLGSAGAHTQCHYDTYGCNLVAQIYGKKRWILFPPSDTDALYPTRIPYEESSVFSSVNISNPDLQRHPKFSMVSPYIVTLEPGDVLYVPRHWWHDVTSVTTSMSINTWLELPSDNEERVREAIVRTIAMTMIEDEFISWLNPTEEFTSLDENLKYLERSTLLHQQYTSERRSSESEKDFKEPDLKRTCVDVEKSHCSCSNMKYDSVDLTQKARQLSLSNFKELQALVEKQADLTDSNSEYEAPNNEHDKNRIASALLNSLLHPHVIKDVHRRMESLL